MSQRLSRRRLIQSSAVLGGAVVVGRYSTGPVFAAPPPLEQKDTYVVGFAQTGSTNPWRLAETASMKETFEGAGHTLIATDANEDTAKQLADLDSIIAQQPDIVIFPPRESQALAPAVLKMKQAGIPVILIDRDVDHAVAKPGEDYIAFIGSDFVQQGARAAEWLVRATGGNAKIIELQGTTGADPAIDRQKGFVDYLAGTYAGTLQAASPVASPMASPVTMTASPVAMSAQPGMEIIASQTGNFTREEGRVTMETLLQANPDVTAVYAHNDEMAIGAISALEAAGRVPGQDVILVSIDCSNAALDAIVEGKLGASVESSPFFGPISMETMMKYVNGEDIPDWVLVEDRFFDETNAAEFQGKQY